MFCELVNTRGSFGTRTFESFKLRRTGCRFMWICWRSTYLESIAKPQFYQEVKTELFFVKETAKKGLNMLFSARTCTLLLYWSRIFENILGRTYRTFKCSGHSLQNVNLQDESIPIFYNKYRGGEAHATKCWEQPAVCALNNRIHCGLWGLSLCTHCHEPICSNPVSLAPAAPL